MKKNLLKSKMSLHEDNNKTLAHKLKKLLQHFQEKSMEVVILLLRKWNLLGKSMGWMILSFWIFFLIINLLIGKNF